MIKKSHIKIITYKNTHKKHTLRLIATKSKNSYIRPMIEINSKERKLLEKAAHDIQPVVIVGGAGVTDGVIQMVETSLAAHELIKIKYNEYKDEKIELTDEICQKCDATLVRIIGNVAILFRQAEKEEDRKYL